MSAHLLRTYSIIMINSNNFTRLSSATQYLPYLDGIKTYSQNSQEKGLKQTVGQLLSLAHCIHFSNLQSETEIINEKALATLGYVSEKEAQGKTIEYVARNESAKQVIAIHNKAITTHKLQLNETDISLKEGTQFQCMSIIRPWYNHDNQVVGVFGCNVVMNQVNILQILQELTELGLFNTKATVGSQIVTKGSIINNIYLSKRETECLRLYIRGKTVKEIARIFNLSPRSIEHYLENIKNKIGVFSKHDLIQYVIEHTEGHF